MLHRFVSSVALSSILFLVVGSVLAGNANYEFNGNLDSSTGQAALIPVGYPGVATAPTVTFETSLIGGQNAQVARVSKGTALAVYHGFLANGGGAYLNQYTLIMDAKFPGLPNWVSLYQTNQAYDDAAGRFDLSKSNDGDWFINDTTGGIGISGNYGGSMMADTWHRLALVVDLIAGTYTSYIDGVQVQQNTGQGLDGRFALYTSDDPDPYDWFFLFADETAGAAEMGEVVINSFQFQDRALTGGEIAALGGPTAKGIAGAVPAPALSDLGAAVLVLATLAAGIAALRRRGSTSVV